MIEGSRLDPFLPNEGVRPPRFAVDAMGGRVEKLLQRVADLKQEVAALRREKKGRGGGFGFLLPPTDRPYFFSATAGGCSPL